MDFFSRCKMCLQCLPFTSSDVSPPSSPRPPPSSPTPPPLAPELSHGATPEKPSFSDASLALHQHEQGLPVSDGHATELDVGHVYIGSALKRTEEEEEENHGYVGSAPKSEEGEENQMGPMAVKSEAHMLPVEAGNVLNTPLPSSIAEVPVGLGYAATLQQGSPSEQSAYEGRNSHHHHHHLHHPHHHHHLHDTQDNTEDEYDNSPHPPALETSMSAPGEMDDLITGGREEEYDKMEDSGDMSLLVSSQSEPVGGNVEDQTSGDNHGRHRIRRRDQLKHQLMDLRKQIKQGGQVLKEEGSKHLRDMVNNMNTQAQQLGGVGSGLFIASPTHGNES